MIRKWEEFPEGPRVVSRDMHVTLNRKGEIMIGAAAYERFGEPEMAKLYFDWDNKTIGVLPANRSAKNAYPLKGKKEHYRHRTIRANRFCRAWGIHVPGTTAFNNPAIEDGMLVLNLKDARVIGRVRDGRPETGDGRR